MALKTNVHIRYRTPYMPGVELPNDVEKLMRKEISNMRKDLLKKQEALERSPKYESNERLKNQLLDISVKKLKSKREVWDTWNRLRNLELSHQTSVAGKNESRAKAIASFNQSGFTQVNDKNYDDFTKFMEKAKEYFDPVLWDSEEVVETYFEYADEGDFIGMSWEERYQYMVELIMDEIEDRYRYYNTPTKKKQGIERSINQLNKSFIAKNAFNVPKTRKRVTNKEIQDYYKYKKGKKLK